MSVATPRDRLQPSLLDRLSDDQPGQESEAAEKYVLTPKQLKEIILRDLSWLLNTTRLDEYVDLDEYPNVADSVVNYGAPDLAGRTFSNVDAEDLEERLRNAIRQFEPRILPEHLSVTLLRQTDDMSRNAVEFRIEGEIWNRPVPLEILLKSEIDLEDGHCQVAEDRG